MCGNEGFGKATHLHSNRAGFFRGDAHKMGLGWLVPDSLAKSMCFIGEPNCLVRLWDTAQRAQQQRQQPVSLQRILSERKLVQLIYNLYIELNESIWERRMNEVITGKCHVIVQTAMPLHPNPKVLSPLQVRSSQCGPLPCCARPVRASAP